MNSATQTTPIRMVTLSRLVLALVMAVLLGSMLAQSADAVTVITQLAKHQSKSDFITTERITCQEGIGGTFTEKTLMSGDTMTHCKGDGYSRTCVVTDKVADCETRFDQTAPESSVPDDISAPPTEGVYDEPTRSVQDDVSAPPSTGVYQELAAGDIDAGAAAVEGSGHAEQPGDPALIPAEAVPVEPVLETGAAPASDGVASEPTPVIAE
jgi:hypothetical protein